jgi:hypothetical protein
MAELKEKSEYIELRNLLLGAVKSMEAANLELDKKPASGDIAYAVTELEFSLDYRGLQLDKERFLIALPRPAESGPENRSIRFSVRLLPKEVK